MLKVFSADSTDLNWMINLYLEGAKEGHFLMDEADKNYRQVCERNFTSIVFQKQMVDFDLQAYATVFEDSGNKVGYTVMSEIKPGMGGNEIHLFIVDKDHRHKGYGNLMLAEIIKRIQPIDDLYIRCFPASTHMISLIKKKGFIYTHTNAENAEVFVLRKPAIYA